MPPCELRPRGGADAVIVRSASLFVVGLTKLMLSLVPQKLTRGLAVAGVSVPTRRQALVPTSPAATEGRLQTQQGWGLVLGCANPSPPPLGPARTLPWVSY